jgi:hypothetical protein
VLIALFLCYLQVQEELQAGLVRSPRYIERMSPETPPAQPPMWKLAFRFKPQLPIFTGSKIEDVNGNPLEIILVDVDTGAPATISQPLRVEVVPVLGDFPPDDREHWTAEEFQQRGIVKERSGKRPLLTGDVSLTMRDGCVVVNELQFTDNSSWVRCRRFRIGVRVVPGSYDGPRIGEAMTEPFVVRDHRGERTFRQRPSRVHHTTSLSSSLNCFPDDLACDLQCTGSTTLPFLATMSGGLRRLARRVPSTGS